MAHHHDNRTDWMVSNARSMAWSQAFDVAPNLRLGLEMEAWAGRGMDSVCILEILDCYIAA
jgi:hypothetical protein